MTKFTIETQEQFNDCLLWISDLSKEAYGFRVRNTDWAAMSFEELAAEVNHFSEIAQEEAAEMEAAEEAAIQKAIAAGAGDRETAKRWLEDAMWS